MKKNYDSVVFKGVVILVLTVLLLIPIFMVTSLIDERADNKERVVESIRSKWGGSQVVSGPILALPYAKTRSHTVMVNKVVSTNVRTDEGVAYFLPEKYKADGFLKSEERAISIYKTLLYQADLTMGGEFIAPDLKTLDLEPGDIKWDKASLIMGISHMQGIADKLEIEVNDKKYAAVTGAPDDMYFHAGVTFDVPLTKEDQEKGFKFNLAMKLNGSEDLYLAPVGKENKVHLQSDWKTVSLLGDFIASERDINESGFDAEWNVFDYNRNYKQMWLDANHSIMPSLGVSFKFAVEQYQMTTRAVKYALMFIVLTFVVFFLVEVLTRKRIHPIQYLLVSLGLIIFYSLLIALSEHVQFDVAYLISAVGIVALITGYTFTIFKRKSHTLAMGGFLVLLYTYLYVILQLEDVALLIGSLGLFISLGIIMFASRKVDWYKIGKKEEEELEDEVNE